MIKLDIAETRKEIGSITPILESVIEHLHDVLIEGDLNGDEFHDICKQATDAVVMKARITSLGETK